MYDIITNKPQYHGHFANRTHLQERLNFKCIFRKLLCYKPKRQDFTLIHGQVNLLSSCDYNDDKQNRSCVIASRCRPTEE